MKAVWNEEMIGRSMCFQDADCILMITRPEGTTAKRGVEDASRLAVRLLNRASVIRPGKIPLARPKHWVPFLSTSKDLDAHAKYQSVIS